MIVLSGLLFSSAFILALGTIAFMFREYRGKMIAALMMRDTPRPREQAVHSCRRIVREAPAFANVAFAPVARPAPVFVAA
jgi:hypothetical protein